MYCTFLTNQIPNARTLRINFLNWEPNGLMQHDVLNLQRENSTNKTENN